MPLQPPQQVLLSPVTNYNKGKAIRQQLATAEKEEELLGLKIEAYKNPKPDPKEKRMQEKWEAEQYAATQDGLANSVAAAMIAVQENPQLSDQEYGSIFDAALVQNLGEEAAAAMRPRWDKNDNKILDPEERAKIEAWTLGYGKEIAEKEGDTTPKTHINYQMPDGSVVAARPDSQEADKLVAQGGTVAGAQSLTQGKEGTAIKTADANAIRSAAHASVGGTFDAGGELIPLKPGQAEMALQISAMAEREFIEKGGALGPSEAVMLARSKIEVEIEARAKALGYTLDQVKTAAKEERKSEQEVLDELEALKAAKE